MRQNKFLFTMKIFVAVLVLINVFVSFFLEYENITNAGWWYTLGISLGCFYPVYCILFNKDMNIGYSVLKFDNNTVTTFIRYFFGLSALFFLYITPETLDQWIKAT
jgi:hypothetical protein